MSAPRILVVDDQFARDETERLVFLQGVGLTNGEPGGARTLGWAEVVFCSGQREEGARLINDYAVVRNAVDGGNWSLVLLDVQFDSGEMDASGRPAGQTGDDLFGITVRRQLETEFRDLPVLMLTSKRQEEIGETDTPYLSKHKLGAHELKRALLRHGDITFAQGRMLLGLGDDICASDPATLAVFRMAFIYAGKKTSILILGESGTGKEIMAGYMHRMSSHAAGPYVAVNVAAIPSGLVESELFGHEKGAFTGATGQRRGHFEQATNGTLFLDEIGEMPMEIQAKVLRALETRKITRVGGGELIPVDIRLVCATSRDLAAMARTGEFRADLYHRINTLTITMPPLRERPSDIASMARRFLDVFAAEQKIVGLSFSADALASLEALPFPGNVRELKNLVERLVVAAGHHQVVGRSQVSEALQSQSQPEPSPAIRQAHEPATAMPPVEESDRGERMPTLEKLADWLAQVRVDKDDPALKGIKSRLDVAMRHLHQRLAGAALERCRDPNDRCLNRQSAMRLLTGDANLKGKGPARVVNEILGRAQEQQVAEEDLEGLVSAWRQGERDA